MREGAGETREDPKAAGSKKGTKSGWNPALETGPRRESVRKVLPRRCSRTFPARAVSQNNGRVSAAASGREGPGTTHVCGLENGRGQANIFYPLLTQCCVIPSVAVQGEATPREAQLVAGPGFVGVCTKRVGCVWC